MACCLGVCLLNGMTHLPVDRQLSSQEGLGPSAPCSHARLACWSSLSAKAQQGPQPCSCLQPRMVPLSSAWLPRVGATAQAESLQ